MNQLGIGRRDGQSEALTLVLPMKWWGPAFHRFWFWTMSQKCMRESAFGNVDRLRFILAIRWSLLRPFEQPPPRWKPQWRNLRLQKSPWHRTPEQRWHLLFESNFDGDWDAYLDDFGAAANFALRSIVCVGVGYPGTDSMAMFKSFARLHDHLPEYYSSAYPELTAADIRQELHARRGHHARRKIKLEGMGRTMPRWTTFRLPLRDDDAGRAVRFARQLDPQPEGSESDIPVADGSLFRNTGVVHFARVVIIDRPTRSWLLITLTHDVPIEDVVPELLSAEGSGLRRLLECCDGIPKESEGWWTDDHLAEYLLRQQPVESRHRLVYNAYPGWTAEQLQGFQADRCSDKTWPVPEEES